MKVLVAEDSIVMRTVLVSHLQEWDYEVFEARDGKEAWELFQSEDFSLILTDWIMPEIDGLELIRRIRTSTRPGYCYLILLTAKSDKEDLITAMEVGADDFLVKPCDREELRVRLREGERIIRLQQELAQQNQQLRETQAALVESEKLASLGQLAAGMAHEINNPIAFVTNNLAVLRRELGPIIELVRKYEQTRDFLDDAPAELLEDLHRIEAECDLDWVGEHLPQLLQSSTQGLTRVRDIIKNLRDFARLDQAGCDDLDLGQAVMSTLQILKTQIDEKRIRVELDAGSVPTVLCRPDKILQVIYNVILNAVQASELGAEVMVRLMSNDESVIIEVEDNGCGMEKETLSRVFEPFFTTKPVGTGTGLGMAVSYGVVGDHGGAITIDSQPNQGTTVRVVLPIKPSDDSMTASLSKST
ncbi:Sensor protein ZraS [Planctomycetes bacterium CA13]|uniref:histidine kinase n=1 Tax=Novipirellula herctigrandis TaxID=2527986 RepID=A0A5C5YWQ7_9BACT|nr:Sensor protein ZraS [Planctomycetes bacterium CA13]